MKYFFDTEFIERGAQHPIELISIGIVAEDGREYYAVSNEFNGMHASDWVRENVIPHLGDVDRKPLATIARDIWEFCGGDKSAAAADGPNPNGPFEKPEFWAYYCSYDWVVLCQTLGTMMDLPKGWPMYCNDLKIEVERVGNPKLPKQTSTEHNALEDARWLRDCHGWLERRVAPLKFGDVVEWQNAAGEWVEAGTFQRHTTNLNECLIVANVDGLRIETSAATDKLRRKAV